MVEHFEPLETFQTFGDLLKYLRRRAMLTQKELSIAVGYSVSQISRLESNLRTADRTSLTALFVPALDLEDEPKMVQKLLELAEPGYDRVFLPISANGAPALRQDAGPDTVEHQAKKEAIASPSNFPAELSSFIGRECELARIIQQLTTGTQKGREPVRLLTLTGAGGCGKTRLALRAGKAILSCYPQGVWLVELAPYSDPSFVPLAVASALGLMITSNRPLLDQLADFLKERHLLLVLDNCEHLIEPAARLAERLLRTCPSLQILATSREPLGVPGEVNLRVPSLSLPPSEPPGEVHFRDVESCEAVQLFVERAQSLEPDFEVRDDETPALVKICRSLDGIPLAIELAAARVSMMDISQIAGRLDDSLRLLVNAHHTAVSRHRTLKLAIDWSYNLLSEPERVLLRRLAVFASTWTLEAAEAVCGWGGLRSDEVLNLLAALVNKSLVVTVQQPEIGRRYHFLGILRQYMHAKQAEAGEENEIQRCFRGYYALIAEQAELALRGPDQMRWLKWLDQEHDNLRAALGFAIGAGDAEIALRLAGSLGGFWDLRGLHQEGCHWLEAALKILEPATRSLWRAKALLGAGILEIKLGNLLAGQANLEESLSIYKAEEDPEGTVAALNNLAILSWHGGDAPGALARIEESLSLLKDVKNPLRSAEILYNASRLKKWHAQDFAGARSLLEQSIVCAQLAGDRIFLTGLLNDLSWFDWDRGAIRNAGSRLAENISICRAAGDKQTLYWSLSIQAFHATFQGNFSRAREALDEMLTLAQFMVNWNLVANAHQQMGLLEFFQGNFLAAHASFEAAIHLYETFARSNAGWAISKLGDVFFAEGNLERAIALQEEGLSLLEAQYSEVSIPWALRGLGNVARAKGDHPLAMAFYQRGLEMVHRRLTIPDIPFLLEPIAKTAAAAGHAARAARLLGAAQALRNQMGMPILPVEQAEYEHCLVEVQKALDPEAFAAAWAEGEGWTADGAARMGMGNQ